MTGKHDPPENAKVSRTENTELSRPESDRSQQVGGLAAGNFWDTRFANEGCVWSREPARSAVHAADLFEAQGLARILVPGCAYGRNTGYLAGRGFAVVGIDSSAAAVDLARARALEHGGAVPYLHRDFLDNGEPDGRYDGIYSFSLLHLFLRRDRARILAEKMRLLRPEGLAYVVAFSDEDPEYGRGVEVEENTFDYRGAVPRTFLPRRIFAPISPPGISWSAEL